MKKPVSLSMKLVAVLFGGAFILNGCGVDRSGLGWIANVQPQYVCPGEHVTVNWNTGAGSCIGGGCPPPVRVGIISAPPDPSLGILPNQPSAGSHDAGPINADTTFTFNATGGDRHYGSKQASVAVVEPPPAIKNVPLNFSAGCSGSAVGWAPVNLSVPTFRSSGVRLLHVCNYTSNPVVLTLSFSAGSPLIQILTTGGCTTPDPLSIDLGRTVMAASASVASVAPPLPGACGVHASDLPPDINLTASLECDLTSTTAPLVYVTPTEAPTKSGIILLPGLTPTFTLTSIPTAGLAFNQPGLSVGHFYSGGAGCGPLDLKLQVQVSDPDHVSSVVLFFHLKDKAGGGTTPWNEGVVMEPLGSGQYSYDLVSKTIPAFNSYPEAWLVYQFAATGAGGQVVLRSPPYSDVTLTMCGKK
jgi:hypothetical protein